MKTRDIAQSRRAVLKAIGAAGILGALPLSGPAAFAQLEPARCR
jgi:hypothetical protein